jgi:hypothetical protein
MDAHDILNLEKRLADAVADISKRVDAVATARQVKEYDSDRRKQLLARYTAPHLLGDKSATAADALARADERYGAELDTLADNYRRAEKHIAEWDAAHCRMEAARSALSLAKEQIKL